MPPQPLRRVGIDDARASMAALVVLAIRYGAPKADADRLLPEWWHENVPEARRAPHSSGTARETPGFSRGEPLTPDSEE